MSNILHQRYPAKPLGCKLSETLSFEAFAFTTPKKETGFTEPELREMWDLINEACPDRLRGPDYSNQRYYYLLMKYLHSVPTQDGPNCTWAATMCTNLGGPCSLSAFYANSVPIGEVAAMHAKAFSWSDRLAPNNHHPLMPFYVTTAVDGFPVVIKQPKDKETFKLFNSGKYRLTCVRGELVICIGTGHIVAFGWPYRGCANDAKMRTAEEANTPMLPNEIMIGDKAYKASTNCLTGYIRPPHGSLTTEQKAFNNTFNGVRQRVSFWSSFYQQAQTLT
jgi:hypothetical protein